MQNLLTFFHFLFIDTDILLLPQVRLNALNTLYQFPLSDELTSKNSDGIRKGLLAALADDDEQLAVSSILCFKNTLHLLPKSSLMHTTVTEFAGELFLFLFEPPPTPLPMISCIGGVWRLTENAYFIDYYYLWIKFLIELLHVFHIL